MEPKTETIPSDPITLKNLEDLINKVKAIVQGPNSDLLLRFVDVLYKQEHFAEEHFSPDDLADIQAGIDEIRRGETVSWVEFKKEHNL